MRRRHRPGVCCRALWLALPVAVSAGAIAVVVLADERRDEGGRPDTAPPGIAPGSSLRTVFTPPRTRRSGSGGGAGVGGPGTSQAEFVPGRLIVKFADDASPEAARRLLQRVDADVETVVDPLDVRVAEVSPDETRQALAAIAASPVVEYVERDVALHSFATTPNDTLWPEQWGPALVAASDAWDTATGSPDVVVAVLDTGVDAAHPDLGSALVAGHDFVNGDADPADDEGHGTAAAGVVAARTNNARGQAGICWRCSVMPVKVLDASGSGSTSDVAAGIVWAVDHGARVISMSLGGPEPTQTLVDAVGYAVGRGAVLVAAAGNDGTSQLSYPAALEGVLSVAGTTRGDELYSWSNFGGWVHVAAPGCNVATYPNAEYVNFCGTSSATPIVAGLAGLAFSARPRATREQVHAAVTSSVVSLGSVVVYGRVDVQKALAALGVQAPAATTPAPATSPPRAPRRAKSTRLGAPLRLSGRVTAVLTTPGRKVLSLVLVDSRGATVARVSGRSPLRFVRTVPDGRYRFVVRGSENARVELRITSAG